MVYVKMDAFDQLLLSEGVYRQLGIVTYHPSLLPRKVLKSKTEEDIQVPSISVSLVQSLRLPPNRSAVVPVKLEGTSQLLNRTIIVEGEERVEKDTGIIVEDAVVSAPKDGLTHVVVSNLTGFTQTVPEGTFLCGAQIADVVTPDPEPESATEDAANVKKLSSPQ